MLTYILSCTEFRHFPIFGLLQSTQCWRYRAACDCAFLWTTCMLWKLTELSPQLHMISTPSVASAQKWYW